MVDIVADISELLGSASDDNSCNQCTKSFSTPRLLAQHQQMFHTDKVGGIGGNSLEADRSFVCEICGKAFRFRSNLAEHRSVHTALKPYVCKFCGKSSRLKGNLTKHIQKHHKKESSECIGQDDIIVKKDNSAENYLDNSMNQEIPLSLLPKEETNDHERSILISLGLDYNGSIDLRDDSPEASASPDNTDTNASPSMFKSEYVDSEASYGSPMQTSTVGGETSLAALIACVSTPPQPSTPVYQNNKTKCELCGKHFRKREQMTMHMTINHGFPPPESTTSSEGKTASEVEPMETEQSSSTPVWMQQELKNMKGMVEEMRNKYEKDNGINKVEQLLVNMDSRVGRLEKQLEMALNSIYTLVQLQTGMNSNVTRFREEASEQLKSVHQILKDHSESP